jgi:hypothetical protein
VISLSIVTHESIELLSFIIRNEAEITVNEEALPSSDTEQADTTPSLPSGREDTASSVPAYSSSFVSASCQKASKRSTPDTVESAILTNLKRLREGKSFKGKEVETNEDELFG